MIYYIQNIKFIYSIKEVNMMFYENQPVEQKENYKNMLKIMGKLSKLFSESNKLMNKRIKYINFYRRDSKLKTI